MKDLQYIISTHIIRDNKMLLNVLTCFTALLLPAADSAKHIMINTTSGPIKGNLVSEYGVNYYSFQGIPYAENPTGDLRFRPPVPKTPWVEVKNVTVAGAVCPQKAGTFTKEQMSEDCLNLNVFVPAAKTKKLWPILVYVHGGDYKSRSNRADDLQGPQLLLRHGIMVITPNYRIGALGFLSLETEEASGNAGLKDILLALKWINANAERFGGDRNKITIGGNSAGATTVHHMLLSTKTAGLFNKAILYSGSALIFRHLARHPKEIALALGKQLGLEVNDTNVLLQKLKNIDAFDIAQAQEDMGKNNTRKGFIPFAPFAPNIEIDYSEAFLTQDPRMIIEAGIPQNVPVLAGFNTDEGLKMFPAIRDDSKLVDYLNEDFQRCIPSDIEYPYGSQESIELATSIREFYLNGLDICNSTLQGYIDLVTDATITYGVDSWVKLHEAKEDSNKLFYYLFGFDGDLNWAKIVNNVDRPGTAHADELGYIFVTNATKLRLKDIDTRSQRMVDTKTSFVTNFVKFGNPTPDSKDVKWSESGRVRNYLYVDDCLENVPNAPTPQRLQFWYDVYHQYYEYLKKGGAVESKTNLN